MARRALITGDTRGIGKSLVREFAGAGFDVAFTGRTLHESERREEDAAGNPTPLFMAQEFVRERELWLEWETALAMNLNWSPTAILEWRESGRGGRR